jgi:hypothetical protein
MDKLDGKYLCGYKDFGIKIGIMDKLRASLPYTDYDLSLSSSLKLTKFKSLENRDASLSISPNPKSSQLIDAFTPLLAVGIFF